jgi:two-component system response regulator
MSRETVWKRPSSRPGTQRKLLVLHVEDDSNDQFLFAAACRHAKLPIQREVVDSAVKGIAFLQDFLDHTTAETQASMPDLVLLDLVMSPENGFEVLKYVRQNPTFKSLPVIILTGSSDPEYREEAARLGARAYLMKPQSFGETVGLARAIYRMFGSPEAAEDGTAGTN